MKITWILIFFIYQTNLYALQLDQFTNITPKITTEHEKKIELVFFLATWCGTCHKKLKKNSTRS